ncbi:glycosyltransferase family 4 protein [Pseudarthrobacter sp. J64]|uniref:glycosyltransferase family 4 protein n=1 Tax=Pseudarthrobacter sp. J64 TaxID=3116485 RepID=UPI002E8038FE|nr:glycosyltransferase family 4 protein [Pseudarthrobacter sp. J64]MEE2567937.1 glycosyltransferase family 4 protein [Pseudarthrobacter sp. J64]
MRIAVFLKAPEVWGAETSLLTLLATPAAKEHEITVFVPSASPLVAELEDRGIRWKSYEFASFRSLEKGGLSDGTVVDLLLDGIALLSNAWRARAKVRSFDLILTFGLWETPEIAVAGRFVGVPVVWDFHVTFTGKLAWPAMRVLRMLVSGIVAPSEATYRLANIRRKPAREHVVRRPVVPVLQDVSTVSKGTKTVVGIFGQIENRKSVLELLNALVDYQDSVKVHVVGAQLPENASEYEHRVREFVAQRAPTWEIIPRTTRVAQEMGRCHFIVNLSKHEAFGRTVVEAILAGAQPIVLSGDGPEEIVRNTGIGSIISSPEDLPSVVFSSTFEHRGSIASDERDRVATMYSPAQVAREYFGHLHGHALSTRQRGTKGLEGKA